MMGASWQAVQDCASQLEAELVAGLLRTEAVPVFIEKHAALPGLEEGARVLVPAGLLHRARWLLAHAVPSDAELAALAAVVPPEQA